MNLSSELLVQYQKPAFSVSVCLTPHSRWTILHVAVTLMFYRWTSHVIWLSNVAEKPAPKVPNISLSFNESINAHARLGHSELGWKPKLPLHVCLSLNDRCFWKRGYLTFVADAYERSRFATKQKKLPAIVASFRQELRYDYLASSFFQNNVFPKRKARPREYR